MTMPMPVSRQRLRLTAPCLFMLLSLVLASCSSGTDASEEDLSEVEYEVICTVMKYLAENEIGHPYNGFVLHSETVSDDWPSTLSIGQLRKAIPQGKSRLKKKTLSNYSSISQYEPTLVPEEGCDTPHVVFNDSEKELHRIPGPCFHYRDSENEKNYHSVVRFSRVGINKDQAILYCGVQRCTLGGMGEYYILYMDEHELWHVVATVLVWMS